MNRSESKYFNTARLMDKALVELLERKDFEYISVKEICEKAGVNRSTFYLHYETMGDLLNEAMEQIMEEFLSMFPASPEQFIPQIEAMPLAELVLIRSDYVRPYLTFVKEHRAVYAASFKNPKSMQAEGKFQGLSQYVLSPILNRFHVPRSRHQYMIDFYINGCAAIIRQWVQAGCQESVEEMEQIIMDCVRPGVEP